MTITRDIRRQQRQWARHRGIAIDRNGYVDDRSENFFLPLSPDFLNALGDAGGGELKDQRNRPAKIRALHSSAVLAINVFQHWERRGGTALPAALGYEGMLESVEIERQFDSGLRGTPPTLDVVLAFDGGQIIAIESKFTEWMSSKRLRTDDFRAKYLGSRQNLWAAVDLPRCQSLAQDIGGGSADYRQLDALQLLKHALGLRSSAAGPFSLAYLYYDVAGESDAAERHRAEIDEFAARVDRSLGFTALTYQTLFSNLVDGGKADPAYLDYLQARYFPGD